MAVVRVDANNPANFKQKVLLPKGKYVFECRGEKGQAPVVSKADSSSNMVVRFEHKVCDEGEYMGSTVYDTCTITAKAEWRLVHLALACGTQTKEDIAQNGVDLDKLNGARFEAEVNIEVGGMDPTDPSRRFNDKNRITRFLFEPVG